MEISKPFEGLKIVELASVLAGPMVGMFFAELGAEVIKIENAKTGGDVTRKWKLPVEKQDEKTSAYYLSANWGKKIIFEDISIPLGKEKLLELLKDTDVLLVNFKAGDAEKFKLDYKTISNLFPHLIYASITGFGENDSRPAFDLVLQAETGFMSMNGTKESGPLKMPVAFIDLLAAHQLKEGILVGLIHRMKTGIGCQVHVSLFDAAISSLANQASNFLVANHVSGLEGSLHPNIAPYGEIFNSRDNGKFVLAVGTDQQFARLIQHELLKKSNLENKFAKNQNRVSHRIELASILQQFFSNFSMEEIGSYLKSTQTPFGIIKSLNDVLESPDAKHLILDGKCVKTSVFSINSINKT